MDGSLTDAHAAKFAGSQSFRPPRSTRYNMTVASAAGGRGICNSEFGRGLRVRTDAILYSTTDYLVLVGQKGLGPCDSPSGAEIVSKLCKTPPWDLQSSNKCGLQYMEWVNNQTDLEVERTLNLAGGGGGGGTSFVGYTDIRPEGDVRVYAISGAGGGSSAVLDYTALNSLLPENPLENASLYRSYLNGSALTYDPLFPDNAIINGYRVSVNPPAVTAGAGGGFFINSSMSSNQQDGHAVGRSVEFASGGLQCARNDYSLIPTALRWGDGGFGGGGGGCGGGGGGGGITGGSVLAPGNTAPGGGGYTFVSRAYPNNTMVNVSEEDYNDGNGYVDIVAADCGCVYRCEVFEEEDQFQCLCPNYTTLAPDLSDCFHSECVREGGREGGRETEREGGREGEREGGRSQLLS